MFVKNEQKRLKNDKKWIVWKNMEIIVVIKSWKNIKSGANVGYIFHIFLMFFHQFPSTNHQFWWKKSQNLQKTINPKKVDFIVKKRDNFVDWKSDI